MENIATITLPHNVEIFIYDDDVCLVARGPHWCANLQRGLNMISNKSKELGLKMKLTNPN